MRHERVASDECGDLGEHLGEAGLIGHPFGGDAVDGGVARVEPVEACRRADPAEVEFIDIAVADPDQADGAR